MNLATKVMLFQLALISVSVLAAPGQKTDCERSRNKDINELYRKFEGISDADPTLAAGFMRIGFHDCITAHKGDPKSGCNGSIRFEIDHPFNGRLRPAMEKITSVKGDFPCISFADAVMIAYAASFGATYKGSILKDVVDFNNPRSDTDAGDFVGGDPLALTLPIGEDRRWSAQLAFYQSKGLDAEDLVISNVVGHSLGSFTEVNIIDGTVVPTGRILSFTELSSDKINGDYCGALLVQHEFAMNSDNLPTFNFLESDRSLTNSSEGVNLLNKACSYTIERKDNFKLDFQENRSFVTHSFTRFSQKLSSLTGQQLIENNV